jgi:hypothetical protein
VKESTKLTVLEERKQWLPGLDFFLEEESLSQLHSKDGQGLWF